MRSAANVALLFVLCLFIVSLAHAAPVLGVCAVQAALPSAATGGALSWQAWEPGDLWADVGLVSDQGTGAKGLFLGASTGKATEFLRELPVLSWLPAGSRLGAGWSAQSMDAMIYSAVPLYSW